MTSTAPLVARLAEDEQHSATELVEVLHHCNAVRASADYRMVQAASLIHDEREQEYLARIAAGVGTGEATTLAELEQLAQRAAAGADPRAQYGPTGLDHAVAEVGAALTIAPARARELIEAGNVMRHHLPFTGATLASGRIDLARFLIAVRRVAFCSTETLHLIDTDLAEAIDTREPMSLARFQTMVDTIIAQIDPSALRRRRERVDADRNVSVRPDRHTPGQSRISGALPAEKAAAVDARLTSMATAVHPGDPRTLEQRRADALVALAEGITTLACRCETCTHQPDPELDTSAESDAPALVPETEPTADLEAESDNDTGESTTVEDTSAPVSDTAPRPTFHIVVNLSTLLGHDNDPAVLDGHGAIDADTARQLLGEARRTYLRPDLSTTPEAIARYAPSKKVADLVRAGELCCSFPGCNNRVWHADLDHSVPHGDGGPTHPRNLKPLCRFHHRLKTFGIGWRDYQDPMGTVFFQSPTGHTYLGNAFTGRDLFTSLTATAHPPEHPARERIDTLRATRAAAARRADKRATDRWNKDNPPPF
ncbi:DUF222 domain-containing protein [Gordonia sp. ABSL11-1]|uniref:HNH endonuclease signature motif containing protein n=1 Tax=Gordonia sp. ABSL11-1 TaxID=3053924 RepID=UPI00257378C1|nr:HNH endonuclease signature motif containing protein [Gordonia sp. ABSL11-1]MDL9944931.1 DUF222 domain-containing protein [Gordonia sp. ABSL11-1]